MSQKRSGTSKTAAAPVTDQPDPHSSSDNDESWTKDPQSGQDPDEDRSVDAVIKRTQNESPS